MIRSTLGHRRAIRSRNGLAYEEWLVDDKPLAQLLVDRRIERPEGLDLIPVLAWGQEEDVSRLLTEASPDLPGGRTALLVCPECGDLLCGVASAVIERQGELVIWRELALQEPIWPEGEWSLRLRPWVDPFAFDLAVYERTCREMFEYGLESFNEGSA